MNPDRTVEEIFLFASLLDSVERERYLDNVCYGTPGLRREIESLLFHHDSECPLDAPLFPSPRGLIVGDEDPPAPDVHPGDVIGAYVISAVLGHGGMGIVCLADQSQPVRRKVALKVIRRGIDTNEGIARFDRERQVLALLASPHVPSLLDSGITSDGRPYFVMEYVDGIPIIRYCDVRGIRNRGRLKLFIQMCLGLRHAHDQGVVHRDIKPANVLVTKIAGKPVVKIVDFGVAGIRTDLSGSPERLTKPGFMPGTPEYMSPERVAGGAAAFDPRIDVFSAGVLFHELLLGGLPHVMEDPNVIADGVAGRRFPGNSMAPGLRRIARGALEPHRARRTASMAALAEDCRRCLRESAARRRGPWSRPMLSKAPVRGLIAVAAVLLLVFAARYRMHQTLETNTNSAAIKAVNQDGPLRVPGDFQTIGQAIEAATFGDTIRVAPGTYDGNLVMKDGVVLESEQGPEVTILDGGGRGRVIDCIGLTDRTVIRGFTITHGVGEDFGGGIRCWSGSSPIIERNVFAENSANHGGGIAARDDSYPFIRQNRFYGNKAELEGGAIYGIDGLRGILTIQGNEIWGNSAGPVHSAGGGVWIGGIHSLIADNRFGENTSADTGGGLWAGFEGSKFIISNVFVSNLSGDIGGGVFVDQGYAAVKGNRLYGNKAARGPGIGTGTRGRKTIEDNIES